jgi:hypothetical protein
LTLVLDGAAVGPEKWHVVQVDPGRFAIDLTLDRGPRGAAPGQLLLLSPTFVPSQQPSPSSDSRALGISIEAISLTEGGKDIKFRDLPVRLPQSSGVHE